MRKMSIVSKVGKSGVSVLLLITLSLMLAACGGQTMTPAPAEPTPVPQIEAPVGQEHAPEPVELTISAAASLTEALLEIGEIYNDEQPHVALTFNMGPSGQLQQQIEQGAPADVFISAAQKQMDALDEKDLIVKDTRVDILRNELVLIAGKDSTIVTSIDDLNKDEVKHIGIGSPESVPAGQYAKESLTALGLWDTLAPKLVEGQNVRTVLSYVETGNAEAGFVYGSDIVVSDKVKIVAPAPKESYEEIKYPAAVVKATKNQEAAADFVEFLLTPEAKRVLEDFGFSEI